MRAAYKPLYVEQGASFAQGFTFRNDTGALVDMTDLDIAIKIRPFKDSLTVLAEGSYEGSTNTPSGDIVISEGGVLGTLGIEMDHAITEALDFTQGWYDLEIANVLYTYRLVEGPVYFSKESTH